MKGYRSGPSLSGGGISELEYLRKLYRKCGSLGSGLEYLRKLYRKCGSLGSGLGRKGSGRRV